MKKFYVHFAFVLFVIITMFSCDYTNDNNISLTLSESDHYYAMKAHFSRRKTRDVEQYMDRRLGKSGSMSFVNSQIDGTIALDDHTTFYIKKYPGFVEIKMDKDKNSEEAYRRIKSMCEGIKEGLAK